MDDVLRPVDPLAADWTVIVLLLVFGCLTYAVMATPRKLPLLGRSFFALRLGKQAQRDELDLRDRTLLVLFGGAVLLVGLFTYQLLVLAGASGTGPVPFLRVAGATALVLLMPLVLLRLASFVSGSGLGVAEYFHTVLLFNIIIGGLLLPLAMMMAFPARIHWRAWIWVAGVAIVLVVLVFRWLRATVIGHGEGVPLRYILLYLCAAEIMPTALAYQQVRHLFNELPHPF